MTKISVPGHRFNAGEWAPLLHSRSDLDKYSAAVQTATNVACTVHGPLIRRGGSAWKAEVKNSAAKVELERFQFSRNDAFILEFGNLYIRFFTSSEQLTESALTITGITSANPAVVTINGHGYSDGDDVYITGVAGMTEVNAPNSPYTVANKTTNTFELSGINSSAFTAYSSGGSCKRIYEIVSPYPTAAIPNIQYDQIGDIIYIVHPSYETRKLVRSSSTSWAISTLDASPPPTYETGKSPSTSCTPGATTGVGVTFTASGNSFRTADIGRQIINLSTGETGRAAITALGGASPSATATCDVVETFTDTNAIASGDWKMDLSPIVDITPDVQSAGTIVTVDTASSAEAFESSDPGSYILVHGGVIKITQVISPAQVKGEILKSLSAITETGDWTLERETWSSSRGWPRTVAIYEERLILAGTASQPQHVWGSESGILSGFGVGTSDTDGFQILLGSGKVNQTSWASVGRGLTIGTVGGEVTIDTGGAAGAITPANITTKLRTRHGSGVQQVVELGNEILFIQQSGRKVRTLRFDFDIDNYRGEDLTELAEHMTAGGVKEMAYAQEPFSRIHVVTNDGDLLVGTYVREQKVIAWCRYQTDGKYENVQTISQGEEDQVWVVVKRTINSVTKRYVELFDSGDGLDDTDGFSDSFLTLSNPLVITGITAANPAVVTSASHGLSDGDIIIIKDLVDPAIADIDSTASNMSSINHNTYTVANKTTNTFELFDEDTSSFNAYGEGGNAFLKVTSLKGLDHLEGKVVTVKADGASHPDVTVTSGAITLASASGEVTVGLDYTTTILPLPMAHQTRGGSVAGNKLKRVSPQLRVVNSAAPTFGNFRPTRSAPDAMGKRVELTTGLINYSSLPWADGGQYPIELSGPFPLVLTGIFGSVDGEVR